MLHDDVATVLARTDINQVRRLRAEGYSVKKLSEVPAAWPRLASWPQGKRSFERLAGQDGVQEGSLSM